MRRTTSSTRVPNNSRALVVAAATFVVAALVLSGWLVRHPALADRVGRFLEALNWRGSGPAQAVRWARPVPV
jgi:hypothetical protein